MSAKKCCCCGLLSCFPCFSAQPDSSEIAAPPLTVITNPSPAATLSFAPPSAVAPSQVNASTVMQNDSQTTAPSDAVPSSSRGIVTPSALIPTTSQTTASPPTQPPSFSTPSSSRLPKESDYAETIMEAVKELDKENVDGDFSDLISYISRLLDFIEVHLYLDSLCFLFETDDAEKILIKVNLCVYINEKNKENSQFTHSSWLSTKFKKLLSTGLMNHSKDQKKSPSTLA